MVRRYDEPVEVDVRGTPALGADPIHAESGADPLHAESGADPLHAESGADPLHAEPGAPASFRWRGRRYRVRGVQARWRERRSWWRDIGEEDDTDESTERVVWRVEAAAGASTGVFELGADGGSHWVLVRTLD